MKRVLILLGTFAATAATISAHAQTLTPLERRTIAVSDVIRGEAGPADYSLVEERGALPPRAISALLNDEGFSLLSPPIRRGPAYVAAVIDPSGTDGRITVDAFSGRVIRFRPIMGPNAMILPDDIRDTYARRDFAPPRSIPYVPQRAAPSTAPRAANRALPSQTQASAPVNPATATRGPAKPPAQTAASSQAASSPASGKPPVTLQPTQQMPPAMGFD